MSFENRCQHGIPDCFFQKFKAQGSLKPRILKWPGHHFFLFSWTRNDRIYIIKLIPWKASPVSMGSTTKPGHHHQGHWFRGPFGFSFLPTLDDEPWHFRAQTEICGVSLAWETWNAKKVSCEGATTRIKFFLVQEKTDQGCKVCEDTLYCLGRFVWLPDRLGSKTVRSS